MDWLRAAWCVCYRDLLTAARKPAEVASPLLFFVIVASLFPLAVSPESAQLRAIAPGVVWVAALLATMLSLGRLFGPDHADGNLDLLLAAPHPLTVLVTGKVLAHWLLNGLPLVLIAPLLAVQLFLPEGAMGTLLVSLLLGTPVLSLFGAVGAALTLGLRGGGVLISLLVLPLYTPVLIFGALAVVTAGHGEDAGAYLSLLGALLALSLGFLPWATAEALRVSLE